MGGGSRIDCEDTMQKILRIEESDNLIVALKDLHRGETVQWKGQPFTLASDVRAKHKFATEDVPEGGIVSLYGLPVGKAVKPIAKGEVVGTENIRHYTAPVSLADTTPYAWTPPDVSAYAGRTFKGVVRDDGRVGTANYWLVIPLVFCANRNATKLADALNEALGYANSDLKSFARKLANGTADADGGGRPFPNLDGVRSMPVTSGCGGATSDCQTLCDVLAAYADHPNVAGITVFGLGCEKSQIAMFKDSLAARNPNFAKPALYYRQQDWDSEERMMQDALRSTLGLLGNANECERTEVPLARLKIGVKCGGSDGFSGISANPAMGVASDIVVALGGGSVLAEFPELCGAEGNIVARCGEVETKQKFLDLMQNYEKVANFFGTTMADNPSWGNIQDGLVTDAIKSTGAAKKGGNAPVAAVLDYCRAMPDAGLSLSCTPGNDVDAVTGQVAAGANVVIFSTGLGTPTGNPIVPVVKISTNTAIAKRLSYMIDFDCGPIIEGASIDEVGRALLERVIETASGDYKVKADQLEQFDFMLWKRSLDL
ncbi:MAG: altronate dehydratase [Acetobacteraceae bacterium]|nr:altronate dehydratase [Acetobacteraceae bacterium]